MLTRERLKDALDNLDLDSGIDLWNNYVDSIRDSERHIYYMWELNELLSGLSAGDVLDTIDLDSFEKWHDYFHDSIYGYQSFGDAYDIADDGELLDWLMDNPEELRNTSISDILDDDDETEGE